MYKMSGFAVILAPRLRLRLPGRPIKPLLTLWLTMPTTLASRAKSMIPKIPPKPQLGSSYFTSTGWGWSAYMHSLSYCTDSSGLSPIIRAALAQHRTRVSTRSTHSSPTLTSCAVTIRLLKLWWPVNGLYRLRRWAW